MNDTVDEIGRVAAAEQIDCHYSKGGTLTLARTPAQLARIEARLEDEKAWGLERCRLPRRRPSRADGSARSASWAASGPRTARRSTRRGWPAGSPTSSTSKGVRIYEKSPVALVRAPSGAHRRAVSCTPST